MKNHEDKKCFFMELHVLHDQSGLSVLNRMILTFASLRKKFFDF